VGIRSCRQYADVRQDTLYHRCRSGQESQEDRKSPGVV
jgi:hypothetical protein